MPDYTSDYPDTAEPAYILFDGKGGGEFAFGCVTGAIHGAGSSTGTATTKWTRPAATDGPRSSPMAPSKAKSASTAAMKPTSPRDRGRLLQQPVRAWASGLGRGLGPVRPTPVTAAASGAIVRSGRTSESGCIHEIARCNGRDIGHFGGAGLRPNIRQGLRRFAKSARSDGAGHEADEGAGGRREAIQRNAQANRIRRAATQIRSVVARAAGQQHRRQALVLSIMP